MIKRFDFMWFYKFMFIIYIFFFQLIMQEELFHKTLFTCCLEIVLRSYNDPRRFPWSLQVSIGAIFSLSLRYTSYCNYFHSDNNYVVILLIQL